MSTSTPMLKNFDKSKLQTFGTDNVCSPISAAWAVNTGRPFTRPLIGIERITLAVASCIPTHHLTIASKLPRDELMRAFHAYKSHRSRDGRGPWVYVGTCVKTKAGDAGYHLHLLLWGSVNVSTLKAYFAKFGKVQVLCVPIKAADDIDPFTNALETVSYVLGQEEPVFGRTNYCENTPHLKAKHHILYPRRSTLQNHKPELLLALNRAKDHTVPDDELLSPLHLLDINY